MKILKHGPLTWSNQHLNITQPVADYYDLANETVGSPLQIYNDTTKGIQQIIKDAIAKNTTLRVLGGNWSLSPIAATKGILLNTKLLNIRFTITAASASPAYKGDPRKLCLAQCGTGIWELNDFLHQRGLSLSACGASNGQTIAGAIATGTHGAAIGFGATQDAVVGLHIITGPDKHIWLERASYPVLIDSFADKLGATLVRDDEVFYAALVSFGSFGFVHGVLLETEDDYLLEAYLRRVPYDASWTQMVTALDFKNPKLPYTTEKPFHFQTMLNPYDLDKGAYLTTMYKRPYRSDYTPPKPNGAGIGPGDDAPAFIGKISDMLPGAIPIVANKVLALSLTLYEKQFGRLGEIFNNTTIWGKVSSAAIGLPVQQVQTVATVLIDINKTAGPFAGLFAFRFVKSSKATMAFTHFDPVSCVLELDGVQSQATQQFYTAVWNRLEQLNIPFTFHWGKMNELNPVRMNRMYGNNLTRFLAARAKIMDPATIKVFSNDAMKQWGIDTI
ncbi:FAD-binding protein [Taibaiella soli]|uniref:FAD-binding protein n=1 Tax=Taibaiella soli TaxID=1649169 RepID=A0A2W2AW36_9BACT|nr:FAD-binding protein [Taibaiella soli]PZF72184.1 FAD-binding protein [Taibaiella soli]